MKSLFHPARLLQSITSLLGRAHSSQDPLSEKAIRALLKPRPQALLRLQQGLLPTLDGSFERDALTTTKAHAAGVTALRRKQLADIHARLIVHAGQLNPESAVRAQVNAEIERAQLLLDRLWAQHSRHLREVSQDASEAHIQSDAFRSFHGLTRSAPPTPPLLQQDSLWLRIPLFLIQFVALFAIEMKLNIWSIREVMDGHDFLREAAILSCVSIIPLWLIGFFVTPLVIRCLRHRRWDLKVSGLALLVAALAGALFYMNVNTVVRGLVHQRSQQSYQVVTGGTRAQSLPSLQHSARPAPPATTTSSAFSTPLLSAVHEVRGMSWWLPQMAKGDYTAIFFWLIYAICLAFAGWKGVVFFGFSYFGCWQVEQRRLDTARLARRAEEQWAQDLRSLVTSVDRDLDQMYLQLASAHGTFAGLNEERRDLVTRHNQRIAQIPALLRNEHDSYLGITLPSLKRRGITTRRGRSLHLPAEDFASCLLPDHTPGEDLRTLDARLFGIHAIIESARTRLIALEDASLSRMRQFCQQIDHLWEPEPTPANPSETPAVSLTSTQPLTA